MNIFALIVSFLALVASGTAIYLTRTHNALSVKPLLIFRSSTSWTAGKVHIQMFNKGLGPLVFKQFIFHYEKEEFTTGLELFNHLAKIIDISKDDLEIEYRSFTYPMKGMGMAANDQKTLLKFKLKKGKRDKTEKLYSLFKQVDIKYHFVDFYGKTEKKTFNYSRDYHGEQLTNGKEDNSAG